MHNLSISKKIFLLSFVLTAILIGISALIMLSKASEIEVKTVAKKMHSLHTILFTKIEEKKNVGLTNAIGIASNDNLAEALVEDNRSMAIDVLSGISQKYKNNTDLKNVKLHLHTKDIKSFVREWKINKFGDELQSFRATIVHMKEVQKPFVAFEAGRAGLVLRGLAPIKRGDEYLGSLEFIQGLNSVAKYFEKEHIHFILLMNNSLLSIATKAKNAPSVGNYKVSQKSVNKDFLHAAQKINVNKLLQENTLSDTQYYYTYEYVKDYSGKKVGIFLLGADKKDVIAESEKAKSLIYYSLVLTVMVVLILSIISFFLLQKFVFQKIVHLQDLMQNSIANKDLTLRAKVENNDEIGKIIHAFNNFMDSLSDLILQSKTAGDENTVLSQKLLTTSSVISTNIHSSSKVIQETVNRNSSLKSILAQSLSSSQATETDIKDAQVKLSSAQDEIHSMSQKVAQSSEVQGELVEKLHNLSQEAEQVKDVLNVISDIADQTNLLALNAAIEAARAGEHGRGFAVVADEVRKLAERTQKTLSEINITVQSIVQSINESSSDISNNTEDINQLVEIATNTSQMINDSTDIMNKAVSAAQESSSVSEDINVDITKVMEDMDTINSHMTTNLQSADDIENASHNLADLTKKLSEELDKYTTK